MQLSFKSLPAKEAGMESSSLLENRLNLFRKLHKLLMNSALFNSLTTWQLHETWKEVSQDRYVTAICDALKL